MPPVIVNPARVREFQDATSFYQWLSRNHSTEPEVWIRLHKVKSGLPSITPAQAIDVCLCWGWIDAIRKSLNQTSYLQRYTPRGPRSIWSEINVQNVGRLIREGRMTPHGLKHVEAAKADGRWDRAYGTTRTLQIHPEFQAALDADPAACQIFQKLNSRNRFALAFRVHQLKTPAARARKIAAFVEMLKRGETPYPQSL